MVLRQEPDAYLILIQPVSPEVHPIPFSPLPFAVIKKALEYSQKPAKTYSVLAVKARRSAVSVSRSHSDYRGQTG